MERTIRDSHPDTLFLAPAPTGWRAMTVTRGGEWLVDERGSFSEALEVGWTLPAGPKPKIAVEIAIPARCGVFERLTLPSVEGEELAAMVRLQFEKNLPYPIEDISLEFQILAQTDTETTLMACAVYEPDLTTLCHPLLESAVPKRVTFWAMEIAGQGAKNGAACGLWREDGQLVFGIFENQRLGFLKMLPQGSELRSVLPAALMQAEIAGAATDFAEVLLDPAMQEAEAALHDFFKIPVRWINAEAGAPANVDLTPRKWREEEARKERRSRLRHQLIVGAALYLALIVAGLVYLGAQNRALNALRAQAAVVQPQVDAVIERQARWKALAPAVDKKQFAVELLFQVWRCLPSEDVRITRFELGTGQLTLEGEAPNAQQAIQFAEKLKATPELAGYRFESGPPAILANDHAQFRIFGKP